MKQVFLDTNVIIDYLGNRTGFYDDAAIIMSLATSTPYARRGGHVSSCVQEPPHRHR